MTKKLEMLSDEALVQNIKTEVLREREATVAVIEYLEEIESRRLYSKFGYSTLWEFTVKELGYDSGSAQRRINAMRISRQVPEVKEALSLATLSLSTVSMVEQFTKNERKLGNKTYSANEKKELIGKIAYKSTRETEVILKAISPDAVLPKEKQRAVNAELTEVSFLADQETLALLKEMKRLMSASQPNTSTADALKQALKLAIAEKSKKIKFKPDSAAKAKAVRSAQKSPAGASQRQYLSIHKRRAAFEKAGNQCTFVSPITGKRCESRHQLELEHRHPVAKNGSDDLENLTVLCKSHNLHVAIQQFGLRKMKAYF